MESNSNSNSKSKMGLAASASVPAVTPLVPAPKVFWTYWDSAGPLPRSVTLCMSTWRKYHPDFQVVLLNRTHIPGLLAGLAPPKVPAWVDSPARASDLVRLVALARLGGVWLDATFLLAEPLTALLDPVLCPGDDPRARPLSAYYLRSATRMPHAPVIESWALAARPGSRFVAAWAREFLSIPDARNGTHLKLQEYLDAGVSPQGINPVLVHYLLIHMAAQYLLQQQAHLLRDDGGANFLDAEEGPFRYLQGLSRDPGRAVRAMMATFPSAGGVFKLRSREREVLEHLL